MPRLTAVEANRIPILLCTSSHDPQTNKSTLQTPKAVHCPHSLKILSTPKLSDPPSRSKASNDVAHRPKPYSAHKGATREGFDGLASLAWTRSVTTAASKNHGTERLPKMKLLVRRTSNLSYLLHTPYQTSYTSRTTHPRRENIDIMPPTQIINQRASQGLL